MIAGWRQGWRRRLRIVAELVLGFAMLVVVDRWLTGGTGFATIQPNPLWLPVLVMAVAYGTGAGVVAAGIASAIWLAHVHGDTGERDYLDHLFHLSMPPLLWFVAAVAIGEVTLIRGVRYARLKRQAGTATRNVGRLTEAFDGLSHTNRALQVQVATEAWTPGHVIATATRLSAPDPAERRTAIARLIAMAARSDDFTCYRITGDEAAAWLRGPTTAGRPDVLPAALAAHLARRRGIVHVARRSDRAVLDGVGVVAIPLVRAGEQRGDMIGCLVIHDLPFTAMNTHRLAEMAEMATWLTPLLGDGPRASSRTVRPTGMVA